MIEGRHHRPEPPQRHASLVGRSPADDPTGPTADTGQFDRAVGYDDEPPDLEPEERDDEPIERTGEPVVLAQAVTVVLGALVGLGWIELDQPTVNLVATAVAGVIVATVTIVTRSKVWTEAAVRREVARRR